MEIIQVQVRNSCHFPVLKFDNGFLGDEKKVKTMACATSNTHIVSVRLFQSRYGYFENRNFYFYKTSEKTFETEGYEFFTAFFEIQKRNHSI